MSNSRKAQLDGEDIEFATEVSKKMGRHYRKEEDHVRAFTDPVCK